MLLLREVRATTGFHLRVSELNHPIDTQQILDHASFQRVARAFRVVIVLLGLACGPVLAQPQPITVLAPDLPGASETGGVGRDAETVTLILRRCGFEPEFIVQPFGRHILSFASMRLADAVMTVPLARHLPGESTSAYIWYQNGAFYDHSRTRPIRDIGDLAGLNVVTFQDGLAILELEDMQEQLGIVLQIANQRLHAHLLLLERVDVILADGLITAEVNKRLRDSDAAMKSLHAGKLLRFAPIFAPTPYKMVFRDAAHADAFDRCFDDAYAKGLVTEINERFIGPFQPELKYRYLGF